MRARWGPSVVVGAFLLLALATPARGQLLEKLLVPPTHQVAAQRYENPVLTGDYPDPSVIRTSEGWWAVVTSGGWSPPYSILQSPDLVNWQVAGRVLRRRPRWARGDFWAPEIERQGGRFLVYYAARNRRGHFCVGVATSRRAVGFYHDRG